MVIRGLEESGGPFPSPPGPHPSHTCLGGMRGAIWIVGGTPRGWQGAMMKVGGVGKVFRGIGDDSSE